MYLLDIMIPSGSILDSLYDQRHLSDSNLGSFVLQCILCLDGLYMQRLRLFTAVNEQLSSKFGSRNMLMDYLQAQRNFEDWTFPLFTTYLLFVSSPNKIGRAHV